MLKKPGALGLHERTCKLNPNRKPLVNSGNGWKYVKHKKAPYGTWKCEECNLIFETRNLFYKHKHELHNCHKAWNKGLTKYTCKSIANGIKTFKKHIEDGTITPSQLGKPLTKAHKQAISSGMKLAHKEGRAHNIGESRWNNEHSYPEKWLIKVLDNEFGMKENVDYRTEMPFGKYALDFAWESKKFAIEIDGEQHERFEEYKKRDEKKDELLKENSWSLLRIKWKDCFARPKEFIEIIRNKLKELTIIN